MFIGAFWQRRKSHGGREEIGPPGASAMMTKRKWRWVFLVGVILLISAFFRFYRLDAVPAEPFSDHAEKILDVYDITQGQTRIFFERNTGREAIQFYWTVLVAAVFRTGLSFQSLKIGTAFIGFFTLPFIYLLGQEVANRRVGLLAMLFSGIAYWANIISRIGLRFPLQPFFVAPVLYFLLRGLRRHIRNDFLLSGLCLGLGLHGYTPFRIMPFLVATVLVLFAVFHFRRDIAYLRGYLWKDVTLLCGAAIAGFLPLLRYAASHPDEFWNRAASRAVVESPLPVFFSNLWKGLLMFNLDDGMIYVNSVVHRPALDVVSGALFLLGIVFLLLRHRFQDLSLVAAIFILIIPSISSLAFPDENPALNRAAGALVPVFILVGMTLDGLLTSLQAGLSPGGQRLVVAGVIAVFFTGSALQNFDLVYRQFDEQYRSVVWQTSKMGEVIREFGNPGSTWIIPYEQWIDTRLPGIWAGIPNHDFGLPREELADTLQLPAPKLFIFKASPRSAAYDDAVTRERLQELYPQGELILHESEPWWQSFWVYFVPAE